MRAVVLSLAHSFGTGGATNKGVGISEYQVSERASLATARVLRSHSFPVVLIDAPGTKAKVYADFKVAAINKMNPLLAVEIHCNSASDEEACYGEVIHHPLSPLGEKAARRVSDRLEGSLGYSRHSWPWRGARAWSETQDKHQFFFLSRINCPSLIVEGAFISNDEQAVWLKSDGGAETYGHMVGEGIVDFLKQEGF